MNKAVVISGEASETESEDEAQEYLDNPTFSNAIQGILIKGEDTESDDASDKSVASASSALDNKKDCKNISYDSLLHKKLCEDNVHLHSSLEAICNSLVNQAVNTLSGIDQQLVRSEVTLQSATTTLKSQNASSSTFKNKLHSMLSANFLPNVKLINK